MTMDLALILAGVMAFSLIVYVVSGGADYGGGVWDLFATGPRKEKQRKVIADAIGPIWEANHVWLILVVVVLFSAFPAAFALLCTYLHIPLTLMLIGIVLRGSAFAFRSYDTSQAQIRWGKIFAIASLFTPILLGVIIGTIAAGRVPNQAMNFYAGFVAPWLTFFAFMVGLFTLALFSFLAAVYLPMETSEAELQDDFRKRAIFAAAATAVLGVGVLIAARAEAPFMHRQFLTSSWTLPLVAFTAVFFALTVLLVIRRKYRTARLVAAFPVGAIVFGWTLSQYPYLIPPHLTIAQAAAEEGILRLLVIGLVGGSLILFPAFLYLYRIFKLKSD